MPELKDTKYYRRLEQRAKSADRAVAYRAQCELEDIAEFDVGVDHWEGPRTDDPPESWFHPTGWRNDATPAQTYHGIADVDSGEPIILVLHRARKQNSSLTRYKSESGAFKFSVDWSYVDINLRNDPEHIELHVILPDDGDESRVRNDKDYTRGR
jgi:hypothetical protein